MQEQKLFDYMTERNAVNDIWWIPIFEISAMKCSEGRDLIGYKESKVLAEGHTLEQAIADINSFPGYIENYKLLNENLRKKLTPFRLDLERKAERVLFCGQRFRNRQGDYTCGKPVHDIERHEDKDNESVNINGEYGMCCIEGYDVPDFSDCPYKRNTFGMNAEIG